MNIQREGERVYKKTLIHYIPAVLVPAITNIFLTLGLARILDLNIYGDYTYLTSIAVVVTSILSQWLVQSIQKFYYVDKEKEEYILLINNFKAALIYLFIISFVVWSFNKVFLNTNDGFINNLLGLIMLFSSQSLLAVKVAEYAAKYQVKHIRNLNIQQSFLKLIFLTAYLLLVNAYQLNEIIVMIAFPAFLNLLYFIGRDKEIRDISRINYFTMNSSSKELFNIHLRKSLAYGLPMTGWFIGTNLLGVGDRIILKFFTDSSQVGVYSANYTLVSTGIALLVSPLLQAAHPIIMNYGQKEKQSPEEIALFIEKLSRKFIMVSMLMVVFLFFYYKKISLLLFGSEYQAGAIIIPLSILGIFFWNYSMYGHKGIELLGRPLQMMKYVLYSALINTVLNIVLIPIMGIKGAGIATLIAYISYAFMIKVNSRHNIRWIINYKYIGSLAVIYSVLCFLLSPLINLVLDYIIKVMN
ncbi:polysaccharide biosynthesis C-terminal domain-containing protein [Priestia megaterium]|uniref:Polysaccharide biosynthesis C-terminal domain-containing protein n=1 Tax=Priestia megaterium TaxID=1404 RepID=A0ABD4WR24_PRIMG|nr:polysaccharide biosynthesis C-terminal domain-containing protein [Priestia megaterium]MDD9782687.1 polysaccharide biosynthesis C-terminal domain-containing protein [Priestia megaterium]